MEKELLSTQGRVPAVKSPGDPENARRINTALVLNSLRQEDLLSRVQIARRLRLSKMTVSAIVSDLISAEIVSEFGRGDAKETGGRRPILLTLDPASKFVVGVDIGTTNSVVAIGNLRGELVGKTRRPTTRNHAVEGIVEQVSSMLAETVGSAGVDGERILGIGLSVAGLVDRESGHILLSPDLNWHDVPIREILHAKTGREVVVDNCTRVMTLGERWYGGARNVRNLFYVNVGYGIGSAIIVNGEIYGRNSEFGHLFITQQPVRCDCGNLGCLEAVSSGQAIERMANEQLGTASQGWITVQQLAQLSRDGNATATSIFRNAGKYLGRAISVVANLYNPEKIILGGGVALAGDLLLDPLIEEYHRHVMSVIRDTTSIELSSLGIDAGVIGAAALALNSFVFQIEHINHLL